MNARLREGTNCPGCDEQPGKPEQDSEDEFARLGGLRLVHFVLIGGRSALAPHYPPRQGESGEGAQSANAFERLVPTEQGRGGGHNEKQTGQAHTAPALSSRLTNS